MSDPRAVIAQARELADVLATIPEKIRNRDEEEARTLLPALAAALEAALDRIAALEGALRDVVVEYDSDHDGIPSNRDHPIAVAYRLLAHADPAPVVTVPVRIGPESRLKLSPEMRAVIAADSKLPLVLACSDCGDALPSTRPCHDGTEHRPACSTCGGSGWRPAPGLLLPEPCPDCAGSGRQPPGDGPRGGA